MNSKEYVRYLELLSGSHVVPGRNLETSPWYEGRRTGFPPEVLASYQDEINRIKGQSLADVQRHGLTSSVIDPLLESLSSRQRKLLSKVPFAFIPTQAFNGAVGRTDSGDPFVVINSGLMPMIHYFVEASYLVMHVDHHYGTEEAIEFNLACNTVIATEASTPNSIGYPYLPIELLSPEEKVFCMAATIGMELFVVAHEFAHILLNHHSISETKLLNVCDSESIHVEVSDPSHEQEFQADLLGYKLYLNAWRKNPVVGPLAKHKKTREIADALPLQLFSLLALIECARESDPGCGSHPRALARASQLYNHLRKHRVSDDGFIFAQGVFAQTKHTSSIRMEHNIEDEILPRIISVQFGESVPQGDRSELLSLLEPFAEVGSTGRQMFPGWDSVMIVIKDVGIVAGTGANIYNLYKCFKDWRDARSYKPEIRLRDPGPRGVDLANASDEELREWLDQAGLPPSQHVNRVSGGES